MTLKRQKTLRGWEKLVIFLRQKTLRWLTSTRLILYLYTDSLRFIFLMNFNHFPIKSHKTDLFSLKYELARNFRKTILTVTVLAIFLFSLLLKVLYVFSEHLHHFPL